MLQIFREQRLNELKVKRATNRFGSVTEISKGDWISEVTEGSKTCLVIAHLYEDSVVECQLMENALSVLAPKFPHIKFVRIKSTHAIENWPTRNLPTLFIYQNGDLSHQLLTLKSLYGTSMTADGMDSHHYNTTCTVLVTYLLVYV
jgi:hypothetical protein